MYLIVNVDNYGYIRRAGEYSYNHVIHRETRNLFNKYACYGTLTKAKKEWAALPCSSILDPPKIGGHGMYKITSVERAILELDNEGGGCAIWITTKQRVELLHRISRFKGCYGLWPVKLLNA